MSLFAFSPVLLLFFFLFGLRLTLVKTAPVVCLYTVFVAWLKWDLTWVDLAAASSKGLFLTGDIMFIVFGAVLFLGYLRESDRLHAMEAQLSRLSPDKRLQGILLAWLFGGFIEGASGFGAPAAVVAPFLVGIGFKPLTAILISLLANSTAVTFGAVGTPVRVGFAGLDIDGVAFKAAMVGSIAGMSVPIMILAFILRSEGNSTWRNFWRELWSYVPWTLFAGISFLIPFLLFSRFGYEFPSLLGGIMGITLAVLSLRYGFLTPGNSRPISEERNEKLDLLQLARSFAPYLLLVVVLTLGKLAFSAFQVRFEIGSGLSHSVQLFNPGFAFLTLIVIFSMFERMPFIKLKNLARATMKPLGTTAVSIFFVSTLTYVMIVTGTGPSIRPGMLEVSASMLTTPSLPIFSPFIGALGSFLAGSATVSNLLFGEIQFSAAHHLGLATSWVLALQLAGAAAGNMIALPNILAVQASVGVERREPWVLSRLIGPCLIYLVIVMLSGFALRWIDS